MMEQFYKQRFKIIDKPEINRRLGMEEEELERKLRVEQENLKASTNEPEEIKKLIN